VEKRFNFVGDFVPQGPPPTAFRFTKPTAQRFTHVVVVYSTE
jgi:hypothetical protein